MFVTDSAVVLATIRFGVILRLDRRLDTEDGMTSNPNGSLRNRCCLSQEDAPWESLSKVLLVKELKYAGTLLTAKLC